MNREAAAIVAVAGIAFACVAGDVAFTARDAEIVVAPKAPLGTQFAARELKTFLDRALGADVKVVTAFTPGKKAIVLGTNAWSLAAGIDVAIKEELNR